MSIEVILAQNVETVRSEWTGLKSSGNTGNLIYSPCPTSSDLRIYASLHKLCLLGWDAIIRYYT